MDCQTSQKLKEGRAVLDIREASQSSQGGRVLTNFPKNVDSIDF